MSNIKLILELANSNLAKELSDAGVSSALPEELKAALSEQLEEERKTNAKKAAQEIISLIKRSDEAVVNNVLHLRELRKEIARIENNLKTINRAKSYGMETSNFVPLLAAVDKQAFSYLPLEERQELSVIPDSYTAKDTVKIAVPKKTSNRK